MNILVRHIYVFEHFCILDTFFDAPILYYAKGYDCLINITPLVGYHTLKGILQNEDDYFFILELAGQEKVYHAHLEAHSTPYLRAILL